MAGTTTTISKPIVFCNGYVLNIDSNVGWNQQPSRLTLSVVDAPDRDFDGSNPLALRDITEPSDTGYLAPEVGTFKTLNLSGILTYQGASGIICPFKFEGIVVSNELPQKTESANIKQTVIHDTREVLNNIPVIISNTCRDIKLPNAINAFSWYDVWWPNIGRLSIANVNEFGISWETIRNALNGKPIGVQDLATARLPTFTTITPNYEADGFYFDVLGPSYVSYRDIDTNAKHSYNSTVNDSTKPTTGPSIHETLPPSDWGYGGSTSGIPVGHRDGPIRFNQSVSKIGRISFVNVGRGSGQIIHMDTGFVVDLNTSAASGAVNPAIFDYFGEHYKINLDTIPIQDTDFRIRGDVLYLGELLDQVATFGQFDWFVSETVTGTDGVHEIKLSTIDRRKKLEFDEQAVNDWVDSLKNGGLTRVIRYDQSRELRNEPTTMVLFGGRLEQLTRKQIGGSWFGARKHHVPLFQNAYQAFAGQMADPKRNCEIEFTHLNLQFLAESYSFDDVALRCALVDPEPFGSLYNYLCHIRHPIIVDLERLLGIGNPGQSINFNLPVQGAFIKNYRLADTDNINMRRLLQGQTNVGDMALSILEAVGNVIAEYAREYCGRYFVIKNPTSLIMNWDISSSAYQGFNYNEATAYFRDQDGIKVHGFVVFNKINPLLFKCGCGDKEILIVRNSELITTPEEIMNYISYNDTNDYDLYVAAQFELVDNRFIVAKTSSPVFWNLDQMDYGTQLKLLAQYVNRSAFSSKTQQALFGTYGLGMEYAWMTPTYAYIPVVAKYDRYGPWLSDGIELDSTQNISNNTDETGISVRRSRGKYRLKDGYKGKVELVSDDELTPWVLGGTPTDPFFGMNRAANARVANASSNVTKPINATVVVEGLPEKTIAQSISTGTGESGANISDISITLNENQISTTYIIKNFAAKQREYRTQDFKTGSVLSKNSFNARSYMLAAGNLIYGRLPKRIFGDIKRGGQRPGGGYNQKKGVFNTDDESNNKMVGFVGTNYAESTLTTAGRIARIPDTNWGHIGQSNSAANHIVASIGATTASSGLPGPYVNAYILMSGALR